MTMKILQYIVAFIAALAIANPVCCCYVAAHNDSSPTSKASTCCCSGQSSGSDQQDGEDSIPKHYCPCKDKLKTDEVKHLQIPVAAPEQIAHLRVHDSDWQASIVSWSLPIQSIYQDRSPPPTLSKSILYSVFRI